MSRIVTVRVSHRFSAPADRLFDAWLTPAQASRFLFATRTGNVMRCEINPGPGGGFLVTDRRPQADGDESVYDVVHLIYRSKSYESSSKDYDFSHVGVVEHWNSGARDVHLSMRHKDWLERPQSGETMMTYDLTGDVTKAPAGKKE